MHLVSYYNMFLLIGVHLRNVFQLNWNSSSVGSVCPSYRMMTQSLPYDISGSKQAHHSKSTNDCPYFAERECTLAFRCYHKSHSFTGISSTLILDNATISWETSSRRKSFVRRSPWNISRHISITFYCLRFFCHDLCIEQKHFFIHISSHHQNYSFSGIAW